MGQPSQSGMSGGATPNAFMPTNPSANPYGGVTTDPNQLYGQMPYGQSGSYGQNPLMASPSPFSGSSLGAGMGSGGKAQGGAGVPQSTGYKSGQLPPGMTPQQAQQQGWIYDEGFGGWNAPNGSNSFSGQ